MLWLYWRRSRLVIGIAGAVLGALTALILAANMLAESNRRPAPPAAVGGPASRAKLPSSNAPSVRRGIALMTAAATACRMVSYRGVQIVAWTSPEGSSSYLLDVWHRSGQPELAKTDDDGDSDGGSPGQVPGASGGASVGVLSITTSMLSLLRTNYVIEYIGPGSASTRPAEIVAIRRHDGSLAARYWLDRSTGLPLRREMYDRSGRRVSEGAFIDLTIGDSEVGTEPAVEGPAWSPYAPATRKAGSQPTRARLLALHASGWPVPRTLAGNMALAGVSTTATSSGQVLDASYSDGLSVVSIFMQRGALSGKLPGWHKSRIAGLTVYATASGDLDEQGLAWSADGVVFTVIADAPPGTVTEIVAQLPHERAEGFWPRVVRGLKRIGSWFDPFG